MPQLNPKPWFMILFFSWTIFLTIIPTKMINFIQPNDPTQADNKEHKNDVWNWPW